MDGIMRAFAKIESQWKEDLFFAVMLAKQKLSKDSAEVTPSTGMLLMYTHILDLFQKLQSLRKWNKGMDTNSEEETSYTTQCQEAFLKVVENEHCAKHRHVPVNKPECVPSINLIPSVTASGSGQSSFDPYDLSGNVEEYLTANNVAGIAPGQNDSAAHLLTAARLYLNWLPKAPNNCAQINPKSQWLPLRPIGE